MTEFAVTLRIDKIGDKEALNALNDLDKKGRQIVEGAAGATGRALGDIAAAYERGGKTVRTQLQSIADAHYDNIKAMEAEQRAAEKSMASVAQATEQLDMRNERALAGVSRGVEMVGRTGQVTGRSLDSVIGQVSQMAFAFGPGGQLVAAIGIATAGIVEMFQRTSREAKKAADEAVKEFDRIAHESALAQGQRASVLYSGDARSGDATARQSVPQLRAQIAALQLRAKETTLVGNVGGTVSRVATDEARAAASEVERLNKELTRRNTLLASIAGPSGTIQTAGSEEADADKAGFITDRLNADRRATEKADKALEKYQARVAKSLAENQKAMDGDGARLGRYLVATANLQSSALDSSLPGATTKEQVGEIGRQIAEQIKNDPFLIARREMDKAVENLAKHMKESLGKTLGDGLVAGFEAAFSGQGIGNAFKSLTATVLGGLGGFMEQLGAQMIIVGVALDALASSLLSLDGPAAIAAGVGLVAAGAALKAVAGSFGKSSGSSASSGGGSFAPTSFLSFGVSAAAPSVSSAANLPEARQPMVFNVIGNDPKVQRDIAAIVNAASGRGLITRPA